MDNLKTFETTKVVDYKLLKVYSSAFAQNEMIPARHTCDGIDVNPPIHIDDIPEKAKSLAIIVEDFDVANGNFCHWVVWNIPVTHQIKEKEDRGKIGVNDFNRNKYNGPCPPSGIHHYNFKVYALDCILSLSENSGKNHLEKAMSDHIIGFGILTGKY